MTFINQRFPVDESYGVRGGPRFSTTVIGTSSGTEQRISHWLVPRRIYDAKWDIITKVQHASLLNFFMLCQGKRNTFRFKDWADYVATGEALVSGATIQLQKTYTLGGLPYIRTVTKPVNNGSFKLYKNAVLQTLTTNYTIDYSTGTVTIVSYSSGTYTWTGEFDILCRFDTDEFNSSHNDIDYFTVENTPLIEVPE